MSSLEASNTVAGQIGGKDFWDEDVEEHFFTQGGDSSATRTITCRWDDRLAIVVALSGGATANGVVEINTPPMTYPDASWLFVKGIHPTGVGVRKTGVNGMIGYDFCRMRIDYGVLNKDFGQANDVGAVSLDISNEIISPPKSEPTFGWLSDGKPVPVEATPGISLSTATFERARRNVAVLPVPLIISLLDHINDRPFEGAAKGKIVYKGCSTYRRITSLGAQNWDLSHKFIYRTKHWNMFLRPRSAGSDNWEEVRYLKPVGTPGLTDRAPFDYGDLSQLFQSGNQLPGQINGI